MANGIRIDELNSSSAPSEDHVVPAMKDGQTVKLTVGQILDLLREVLDPDGVGSKALFAALNLSDLDDPEQARENLGLGNSATRNVGTSAGTVAAGDDPRIVGAIQEDGGEMTGPLTLAADPTVAMHAATKQYVDNIIEYGSNANGEYVRFADGTQICTGTISYSGASSAAGNIFGSALITPTPAAAFTELQGGWAGDNGSINSWGVMNQSTGDFRMFSYQSTSGAREARYFMFGRWK